MRTVNSGGKDIVKTIALIILMTAVFVFALYAAKALVDGWPLTH